MKKPTHQALASSTPLLWLLCKVFRASYETFKGIISSHGNLNLGVFVGINVREKCSFSVPIYYEPRWKLICRISIGVLALINIGSFLLFSVKYNLQVPSFYD